MINVERLPDNTLRLQPLGKLGENDFAKIAEQIVPLINAHARIKLLVDASGFTGWSSAHAAATHFAFVRDHHRKIDRIAIIAGAEWQHWLAGMVSAFVHPEVKVFDKNEEMQAEAWLTMRLVA